MQSLAADRNGERSVSAVLLERRGPIAVMTLNNPPVNGLGFAVRRGLREAVDTVRDDDEIKAVVVNGAGSMFCAGADIREFGKTPPEGTPDLPTVIDELEALDKPVVAAIHKVAAGGGLEVALGAHYRVVTPKSQLGLPEVTLGIVPGAGGTQRLPRLVGVQKGLEMIVGGKLIGEKEALELGIVDEITEGDVLEAALAAAERLIAEGAGPRRVSEQTAAIEASGDAKKAVEDFKATMAKRARGMRAPCACAECVLNAATLPFAEGRAKERALFWELVGADEAAGMRHSFFAEREVAKIPDIPKDQQTREINSAGVIGCGTMGGGITMVFANAGIPVTVVESAETALDAGMEKIRANYAATVSKGRLSQEKMDACMALITPSTDMVDLGAADIVVEAVFEEMDVKKEVFAKLDSICKPGAILATNTSTLDIDEIASATSRPEDVVGTHFFSPANVMRLMENVRGEKTAPDVVATVMKLAKRMGKVGVLARVCDGFIGNRMLHQYLREAKYLIEEGALPQDVDRVIFEFGFPMGPFAMSDLAGNDISWRIRKGKAASRSNDQRYSGTIADRICEQGRFGQKTGKGWYLYQDGRTPTPDPEIEALIVETSKELGIERRKISDDEILERCLYPLINEGAKILEEGIAIRASDIDATWVHGYGFPRYRGGPMLYAETIGLEKIVARLKEFQAEHGDVMAPSPLLERLAAEGKGFKDI